MYIMYKKAPYVPVVFLLKSLTITVQRTFVSQIQSCYHLYVWLVLNKRAHQVNKTFFNGFIIISVESSISPQSHSHPLKINKRVKFMKKYGLDSDTVIG